MEKSFLEHSAFYYLKIILNMLEVGRTTRNAMERWKFLTNISNLN